MTNKAKLFCWAMAVALCLPSMLFAVDTFYTGTGGDWDVPANWSTGAVPGPDDNSFLGDFGFAFGPQVVDLASTPSSPIVGDMRIGVGPLGDATLNQTGGDLSTAEFKWNFIGADGVNGAGAVGTYNLSGGSFAADIGVMGVIDTFEAFSGPGELHLGVGSDGSGLPGENVGTLNVSGDASFTANRMYVGSNDGNTGVVNQSSGTVYVDDWLSIGRNIEASGTYNLSGDGSLTVSNDFLSVGENGGASGTMNVSGSASIDAQNMAVGRFGGGATGHLKIEGSGATINVNNVFDVAIDDSNNQAFDGVFVKNDITGTVEFVSDSGGVSPINAAGDVHLNDGVEETACMMLAGCGSGNLVVDLETNPVATADVKLIDVGGTLFGTFAGLAEGATVPGSGGRTITYTGGDGNDVYLLGESSGVDGDFNNDELWNCDDINALTAAIAAGSTDLSFDMNDDGVIDIDDVTEAGVGWLAVGGANNPDDTGGNPFLPGDINIDGTVDGGDFLTWNTNKFQSLDAWCLGDLTASGIVDGGDFLIWNTFKFQSSDGVQAIPEPSGLALVVSMLGCLAFRRRR